METWDAYDENFVKIENMTLFRGSPLPNGVFHLVCDVIVRHADRSYLLMQRDMRKHFGGMWEATAGGSALKGETPIVCAKRELCEETGINAQSLTQLGSIVDKERHTIYVEFLCITDCDKDSIRLQDGETADYKWVSKDVLLSMRSDELVTQRMQLFLDELKQNTDEDDGLIRKAKELFALHSTDVRLVPEHYGGRNRVYIVIDDDGGRRILRVSLTGDRTEEDYFAETEFVRFLCKNGASVADVLPSVNGRLVEQIVVDDAKIYLSLFEYAPGMLISDNDYRYRNDAPLSEYFYNTGKVIGVIHRLSKSYNPIHKRIHYKDKYNMAYINRLIPDDYKPLKNAIEERLNQFYELPKSKNDYGMVHFDFSDGNYHIDMETGKITVFDFDNCMNCWYMFDLANLWLHGVGWCQFEEDKNLRKQLMTAYFDEIVKGYRSETEITEGMLEKLPLFIDMVLIENIVDEFECSARIHELPENEDIEDASECLICNIPYAGFID